MEQPPLKKSFLDHLSPSEACLNYIWMAWKVLSQFYTLTAEEWDLLPYANHWHKNCRGTVKKNPLKSSLPTCSLKPNNPFLFFFFMNLESVSPQFCFNKKRNLKKWDGGRKAGSANFKISFCQCPETENGFPDLPALLPEHQPIVRNIKQLQELKLQRAALISLQREIPLLKEKKENKRNQNECLRNWILEREIPSPHNNASLRRLTDDWVQRFLVENC